MMQDSAMGDTDSVFGMLIHGGRKTQSMPQMGAHPSPPPPMNSSYGSNYQQPSSRFGMNSNAYGGGGSSGLWGSSNNNSSSLWDRPSSFGYGGGSSSNMWGSSSWGKDKYRRKKDKKRKKKKKSSSWWDSDSSDDSSSDSSDSSDSSESDGWGWNRQSKKKKKKGDWWASDSDASSSDSETSYGWGMSHKKTKKGKKWRKKVGKWVKNMMKQQYGGVDDDVYEMAMEQMKEAQAKGYKLPEGWDEKHAPKDNQIWLLQKDYEERQKSDTEKCYGVINFAAMGISWFCKAFKIDWIRTESLPSVINLAIEQGDFESSLRGIGEYIRGTVLDTPFFGAMMIFASKISDAHKEALEDEEQRIYEDKEDATERVGRSTMNFNRFDELSKRRDLKSVQRSGGFKAKAPPSSAQSSVRTKTKKKKNFPKKKGSGTSHMASMLGELAVPMSKLMGGEMSASKPVQASACQSDSIPM